MRVIISCFGGFIYCLLFAALVYAESGTVNSQQIVSKEDITVVSPQEEILPATDKAIIPQIDIDTPQPNQVGTPPESQSSVVSQENSPVTVLPKETADQEANGLIDRLTTLETQNDKLQSQIAEISGRVNLIEERLIMGGVSEQKAQPGIYDRISQHIDRLKDRMGRKLFLALAFSATAIFLLFFGYILFPRRQTEFSSENQHHDKLPAKDIYDPMEGQSNSAKLNLAHAYIEMGKKSKAQGVLYDVLAHGDNSEQEEARKLLAKIQPQHPNSDR
jgi:FimV-like protein